VIGNTWVDVVLWLYGTFFALWLLQWWLGRHLNGLGLLILDDIARARSFYHVLLAPGVALHELSHWAMAKALLVPTGKVALFSPVTVPEESKTRLGYVEIAKSDVWRASLIGLAPLLSGVLIILGGAAVIGINVAQNQPLPEFVETLWTSLRAPLSIPVLYILFAVGNTMLPSAEDRRPWLLAILLPGTIVLALATWHVVPPLPANVEAFLLQTGRQIVVAFAMVAILDFVLSLIVWLLEMVISRLRGRTVQYI
jgi:hypothetical protein